jgi:hypothetical protein
MSQAPDPTPPPIVVADTAEAFALLRDSLEGAYTLRNAPDLAAARKAIDADTPLVICGCHFDEGRLYDLLRQLKSDPATAGVPFLALRALEGKLEDALYESVKIATHALGGNGFIDLYRWNARYGEIEARHRLTRAVEDLASGSAGGLTTF